MHCTTPLTSLGEQLDLSHGHFGWLTASDGLLGDLPALRDRLNEDGYLYLPGLLDADLVNEAREVLLRQLDELGMIDRAFPIAEGVAKQPWQGRPCHHLIKDNPPLQEVLRSGRMMEFHARLFEASVRSLDFTWMRVIGPGHGTAPHADSVYMNRGTRNLYTTWTPLMEIPPDIGGLTVMPGSHRLDRLKKYFDGDVDTYCTNTANRAPQDVHEWIGPVGDGKLSQHPAQCNPGSGSPG